MPPRKSRSLASSSTSGRRPSSHYSEKIYNMSIRDVLMESDDSDGMNGNRKKPKSRQYIDPWDLENYIYLKSKIESGFEESSGSQSPAGEPINSRFYYVPGEFEECRRCCAGMDELTVCNERFGVNPFEENTQMLDDYMAYSSYTDESSGLSADRPQSFDSMSSTLQLCTPNFGLNRMVVPKPMPITELHLPPPPSIPPSSYDYYEIPSEANNYYSLNDCIDCLQTENVPIYATNRTRSHYEPTHYARGPSPYCSTPYHFGLDKKGLLQIDYSCNWNNLHRYIVHK